MTYAAEWKAAEKKFDSAYEAQLKDLIAIKASLVKDLAKAAASSARSSIESRRPSRQATRSSRSPASPAA